MPLKKNIEFLEELIKGFQEHLENMVSEPSFARIPQDKQEKYKKVLLDEIALIEEDIDRLKRENEELHSEGYLEIMKDEEE